VSEQTPIQLITQAVKRHLGNPAQLKPVTQVFDSSIPETQRGNVNDVLASAPVSYRDGVLIQLAYALCSSGPFDLTKRPPGARGTAKELGTFLGTAHIRAVADAYQNIAKNSDKLDRGNVAVFDDFLRWASSPGRSRDELATVFDYVAARVAATARPVLPMPALELSALTFSAVVVLFGALFDTPSEGAHEQFIIAALLNALIQQSGASGYRVETKKLNTSDASSKVAGDIQVMTGSRTIEAYEVTANEWGTKIDRAGKTIRDHDLSRLHIVAKVSPGEHDAMLQQISKLRDDVSVIEIRSYAAALTAALTRQFRDVALQRLYELLDRYQGNVERVNAFARLLRAKGLVAVRNETTDN
jgi:hypothetical protein